MPGFLFVRRKTRRRKDVPQDRRRRKTRTEGRGGEVRKNVALSSQSCRQAVSELGFDDVGQSGCGAEDCLGVSGGRRIEE